MLQKQKTLIYISETNSSVFKSQVISLLTEIKSKNTFNRIILLAGFKNKLNWTTEIQSLIPQNFEIILFRLYPNYSFFSNQQTKELQNVLKRILAENTIIHLRGETLTGNVRKTINNLKATNVKIITDIRGANRDEVKLYLKGVYNPIKYWLKVNQANKYLKYLGIWSDHISCVSKSLKSYIIRESKINTEKISINHCLASKSFYYSDELRKSYREKLNISDSDVLCVFVTGGNGLYQNTETILKKILSKGYKVLNLSKVKINEKNVINLFVSYQEVPAYLSAADIGIVWRENDIVNNVASPVKFSEYVCCGLPVIANNGVHLINDYINISGFGKTINSFEDLNETIVLDLLKHDRKNIANYASSIFSSDKIVSQYISDYDNLLND